MGDGSSAAVGLEDCGGAALLGGGIGRWFKIAAAALGSGGSRRTCNNGLGVKVIKAEGFYYDVGVRVSKDSERGHVQYEGRWLAVMATS